MHANEPVLAQEKAKDLIRMSVARSRKLEELYEGEVPMCRQALVIGGGIAGIQAATDLAEQGFPVVLVEKGDALGGRLLAPNLRYLYPNRRPAVEILERKVGRLLKSDARVLLNAEVEEITGFVGNFDVKLKGAVEEDLKVGVIILAFGASLHDPGDEFGYGTMPNVITSEELEKNFHANDDEVLIDGRKPTSASFILCVGSREAEGFTGCSRYCCPTAIKQAIHLNSLGIDTTIFYRDIRTVSAGAEEMYREARGNGVLFVRIPPGEKPEVIGKQKVEALQCYDELLGQKLEVETDLVILSVGMRPRQPETDQFHLILKASLGLDGFFLERHPELAPVETAVEGVFLAGTVQGPKDIVDSVAQASATAAKAAVLLAFDSVRIEPTVSVVDEIKCRACGTCVDVCPYSAADLVEIDGEMHVARINASLCKGCGVCAAWCPSSAIDARHFTDQQVIAMIDTAFAEETR